jgi:hypothetical protein
MIYFKKVYYGRTVEIRIHPPQNILPTFLPIYLQFHHLMSHSLAIDRPTPHKKTMKKKPTVRAAVTSLFNSEAKRFLRGTKRILKALDKFSASEEQPSV